MVALYCQDLPQLVDANNAYCSTGWATESSANAFDASQLDAGLLAGHFGFGFAVFLIPFLTLKAAQTLLRMVKFNNF